MQEDLVKRFAECLNGVSYWDWIKLRASMDMVFDMQKREAERELRFSSLQDLENAIRSRFG